MKKLISLMLAMVMMMGLASFAMAEGETFELALITDIGTIDDKSFNQGSWEGLVQYAEENGISHKYYQPAEQADDAYLDAIQLAVENGAMLIVTPGFLFEAPIGQAQDMYPDVHFILIDASPAGGAKENTVGILYAEEQSGFLAGYAAVKDGYTKLGYMGGIAVPAVVRYGYGFVQGADAAAKELGLSDVTINYNYTGSFVGSPDIQTLAASWYNDGVEVIFSCGGGIFDSISAAAEAADAKVIGVDVDQSSQSETVITSAMKGLQASVYQMTVAYYDGTFPGGQDVVLGAEDNGVGLPMETSRFITFSQADYDAIFAKLVAGEYELATNVIENVADVPVEVVSVTEIK